MNEGHLLMRLVYGLGALWVEPLGCLLLVVEGLQVLSQWSGLYMSRSRGPRSLYIHNSSIIGGLLFLL